MCSYFAEAILSFIFNEVVVSWKRKLFTLKHLYASSFTASNSLNCDPQNLCVLRAQTLQRVHFPELHMGPSFHMLIWCRVKNISSVTLTPSLTWIMFLISFSFFFFLNKSCCSLVPQWPSVLQCRSHLGWVSECPQQAHAVAVPVSRRGDLHLKNICLGGENSISFQG